MKPETTLLKKALKENPAHSADRLTDDERFLTALMTCIKEWHKVNSQDTEYKAHKPLLFLLVKTTPDLESIEGLDEYGTVFLSIPDFPFPAEVLLCDLTCKRARGLRASFSNGNEVMSFVEQHGLLSYTFVIFLPRQRLVMAHIADTDLDSVLKEYVSDTQNKELTYPGLERSLWEFHDMATRYPSGLCTIWKNATQYQLMEKPEEHVQNTFYLLIMMRYESRTTLIDREVHTYKGRTDIRVIQPGITAESDVGVVFELKVLSNSKSERANESWACKGVRQVHNYHSTDDKLKQAWLGCFDARQNHSSLPATVTKKAETKDVKLFHFQMENKVTHEE